MDTGLRDIGLGARLTQDEPAECMGYAGIGRRMLVQWRQT
jgi:hypothetical protein